MRTKRSSSFKAYLVEPFKQIRFGLHVVAVCFFFVVVLGGIFVHSYYEQYKHVADIFNVAGTERWSLVVNDVFLKNAYITAGALIALALTMVYVVVRRTHKMYGPMVSIMRFVNELRRGNYAARIKIREKDDFQDLVGALNHLADALHSRHGVPTPVKIAADLDALESRVARFEAGVITVSEPSRPPEDIEDAS